MPFLHPAEPIGLEYPRLLGRLFRADNGIIHLFGYVSSHK